MSNFSGYQIIDVINPNVHCTEVHFMTTEDPDVQKKTLILFDNQIKYIEVEEHQKFKRVKLYCKGDEETLDLDFSEEKNALFDLFLRSLYNK